LVAAAVAINESAPERVSVADVATRAGVTTGAIYFHFASKDDLILALIEEHLQISRQRAENILGQGLPVLESMLRVSAQHTLDIVNDPLARAGATLTSRALGLERRPVRTFDMWLRFNEALLARATAEGFLSPHCDIRRRAEYIVASYAGHFSFSQLYDDIEHLPDRILDMWEVLLDVLLSADARPDLWKARARELFMKPADQNGGRPTS
jgi:AcrR family transcriptional regulator